MRPSQRRNTTDPRRDTALQAGRWAYNFSHSRGGCPGAGQRAAANDTAAFELLFGPSARKILSSGDSVQDKNRRAVFAAREKKLMKVERDPEDPHRATILIGEDAFPFPVPLVGTQGPVAFRPAARERRSCCRVVLEPTKSTPSTSVPLYRLRQGGKKFARRIRNGRACTITLSVSSARPAGRTVSIGRRPRLIARASSAAW